MTLSLVGSYNIFGRKDAQVKHHGQKVELNEVEYHIRANGAVQHALAYLPKVRLCADRLTVIMSFREMKTNQSLRLQLIENSHESRKLLEELRNDSSRTSPP